MSFATFISIQNVLSRSVYHFKVIPLLLWELPLKSWRCFVERLLRMDSRVYSKYSQLLLLQSIPLLCIPQCFWCITNLIFLEQTCTQAIFWCVSLYEQLLSWIIKSKNRSIYSGYFQWISHHVCVTTTRQHLCTAVAVVGLRMMHQLVCIVPGVSCSAVCVALYSGGGILLGPCCHLSSLLQVWSHGPETWRSQTYTLACPCWIWHQPVGPLHYLEKDVNMLLPCCCCNYHVIHICTPGMLPNMSQKRCWHTSLAALILKGRHWNRHVPDGVLSTARMIL